MIPECFSQRSQKQENVDVSKVDSSMLKWDTWTVVRSGRIFKDNRYYASDEYELVHTIWFFDYQVRRCGSFAVTGW